MTEPDGTLSVDRRGSAGSQIAAEVAVLAARRYEVLGEVARGGGGRILRARDLAFDRVVAIKEPLDASGAARLRTEAELLAMLQHPSIVPVYDHGTREDGMPFFAMKLVEGRSLRDAIREAPALERRLALVPQIVAIAEAIAYAHAEGVVHRDLKPANVLLGRFGETMVIDWGLAKVLTDDAVTVDDAAGDKPRLPRSAGATVTGAVMGTPAYMAPEQARGEPVDRRADVYAIGAILYHLLAGEAPYHGSGSEIMDAVPVRAPEPVGELQPRAPRDLVAIVDRAMAREPRDRYASASELVDDLVRFQTGRLVAARRYSPIARLRRWLRAHRMPVVVGTLAVASAAMAIALAVRPAAPPDLGAACIAGADRARDVWDTHSAAVRTAFANEAVYRSVAERFDRFTHDWNAARVDACAATYTRGEQSQALLDLRIACLDRRLADLSSLVDVFAAATPAVVARADQASAGLRPLATCSDTAALQAVIPPPSDPTTRMRVEAVRTTIARAVALDGTGQYREGLAAIRAAAQQASAIGYAPLAAEALYHRARLEERTGDNAAAVATLDQALLAAADGHDDAIAALIWSDMLFIVGERMSRPDDALRMRTAAEAAAHRAGLDLETRARIDNTIGTLLLLKGAYDDAAPYFERVLDVREKLVGPDHGDTASAAGNLARLEFARGHADAARRYGERAVAIFEKVHGPKHPTLAMALNNLGIVLEGSGDYAGARRLYERALAIRETALGPEHPQTGATLNNLGNVLRFEGRLDEAARSFERALAIFEKVLGPEHRNVAQAAMNLGGVRMIQKRLPEARALQERAVAIETKIAPGTTDTALAWQLLADTLDVQGDHEGARAANAKSIEIYEAAGGREHPGLAAPLTGLAEALLNLDRVAEARGAAERALALHSKTPAVFARSQWALARALWRTDPTRAHTLAEGALATTSSMGPAGAEAHALVEQWIASH